MTYNYTIGLIASTLSLAYNGRYITVKIYASRLTFRFLSKLVDAGYIFGFERVEAGRVYMVYLKYINSKPVLKQIVLISKPTKRIYIKYKDLCNSYRGGFVLVSTKQGLLTREEALSRRLGGLVLLQIW